MLFTNLPNQMPTPNANNLTGEAEQYWNLYININRSTSGDVEFTSLSSGKKYTTNDYPSDQDIIGKGQQGLMNLLYKYVLKNYIVTADVLNEVQTRVENVTIQATVSYISSGNTYSVTLPSEPSASIYTLRFKTPNNYVAGATFTINGVIYQCALSGTNDTMPASTFVNNRVITANVDKSSKIITFNSSSTNLLVVASSAPTSADDKKKLWVNTSNKTLNYWTGSKWQSIVGVWG